MATVPVAAWKADQRQRWLAKVAAWLAERTAWLTSCQVAAGSATDGAVANGAGHYAGSVASGASAFWLLGGMGTGNLQLCRCNPFVAAVASYGRLSTLFHPTSEMEDMNQDLRDAGYTTQGMTVLSNVLSKTSSQHFLKSVGIKTLQHSSSSTSNESELREQLAAEARAAVQGELNELRKKTEQAHKRLLRQQNELEEYKKLAEQNRKETEENRLLLRQILNLQAPRSSAGPPT